MERVESDGLWSLMCPSKCKDMLNIYGDDFTEKYIENEKKGNFIKQIKARDLWFKILTSLLERGMPYILFKDHINRKSNQKNVGVINSSNLCAEIVEYSSFDEYAVCNLASICLPKFIKYENNKPYYDYKQLYDISRIVSRNLNNLIDINFYPVNKAKVSNIKHRPIAIGVQGLADVFAIFKTSFGSDLSRDLNRKIFETIYFGALSESLQLAKENGPYKTFHGSPFSKGLFQFDLWNMPYSKLSGMWDWESLRTDIKKFGVYNSLVTSCMPTASTSQIMNNNECFEPYTQNIYLRETLAGDYYIVNKHLVNDLIRIGVWNKDMLDLIKYFDGSIQKIPNIPDDIKEIYKTAWEIPQKNIIDMAIDRAPFIDQTQSMNIFFDKPDFVKLNSCLFYGWRNGIKTGIYYLRSKAASSANKFGIDSEKIKLFDGLYSNKNTDQICKLNLKKLKQGDICYSCT